MARQWVVLFDTLGVDTLLPWDDLKGEDMLTVLAGKKPKDSINKRINMMVVRAQANIQRWPEVWAYDTSEDYEEPVMRQAWEANPQYMADLVREKGTNLFKHQRQKEIIV
jgi:hypothetical protein